MTTLERAVVVWKRCREVEVGKCEECPLFLVRSAFLRTNVCTAFDILNDSTKLADELDKREAK